MYLTLALVPLNLSIRGPGVRLPLPGGRVVQLDGHPVLQLTEGAWDCDKPADELPEVWSVILPLDAPTEGIFNQPTLGKWMTGSLEWVVWRDQLAGWLDVRTNGPQRHRIRGGFEVTICPGVKPLAADRILEW